MPAILGPGSVSLETCAETRKVESIYRISFPRRGLFLQKERDRLSKRLIRETEGVIEHAAPGVRQPRPPLCQADRVRTTHFDSTHRSKAHRCNAWSSPLAYLEVRSHVM